MLLQISVIREGNQGMAGIDMPIRYLLDTTFLLSACIVAILIFIVFYLWDYVIRGRKIKNLENQYSSLISEVVIAETDEELNDVLLQPAARILKQHSFSKKLERKIFMQELLKIRKGMSGQAAENIKWLYRRLSLHLDSLSRLSAAQWHIKAAAIQELAQMGEAEYMAHIYRFTNHKNFYVRTEAQVALVKLTGFEGLRFLNDIRYPLTQWQQICLLQQLSMQADVQQNDVSGWLHSRNDSVVELALKIVGTFKLYGLLDSVLSCLQHTNSAVRHAAKTALDEIAPEEASTSPEPAPDMFFLEPAAFTLERSHS